MRSRVSAGVAGAGRDGRRNLVQEVRQLPRRRADGEEQGRSGAERHRRLANPERWEGYSYSDANKGSGITWNEESFLDYIKDPKAKIPNTKMAFRGIKNEAEAKTFWGYPQAIRRRGEDQVAGSCFE